MSFYEPVFRALNAGGMRYVVVGGVATALHGHARPNSDVDLVVDLDREPLLAALRLLEGLGLVPRLPVAARDLADPEIRERWRSEKGMQVFSMRDPGNALLSVDLLVEHAVDFDGLWARAESCYLGGLAVPVASIPDLIALKRRTDRPRDRDDVEHLEAILRARPAPPA